MCFHGVNNHSVNQSDWETFLTAVMSGSLLREQYLARLLRPRQIPRDSSPGNSVRDSLLGVQ